MKIKRTVFYFFSFIFLIFFINSCSKNRQEILVLAVGGAPAEMEFWENLAVDFSGQSGIPVKIRRQATDTDQRRQSLIVPLKSEQKDPDVFLMDVAWIGQFSHSEWLLPLDQMIREDRFNTRAFFASILNSADMYKDQLIALPVYNDCGLLYYRKDLLEKYGFSVPRTWEDLVSVSLKVQKIEQQGNPSFHGFVWQGAQYEGLVCTAVEFISSFKGSLLEDGKPSLTDPNTVEALVFMKDLIHKFNISPVSTYSEMKEEEVRLVFQNGNALFERNWPYAWGLHNAEDSLVKGKTGVALLPRGKGGHASALGGWHAGISRFTDKPEQAWELVKFIVSKNIQKQMVMQMGWNPGRKDLYDDREVLELVPHMDVLKESFRFSVSRPVVPYYSAFSEVIQKTVNRILSGKSQNMEKELAKADNEIRKIMEYYSEE